MVDRPKLIQIRARSTGLAGLAVNNGTNGLLTVIRLLSQRLVSTQRKQDPTVHKNTVWTQGKGNYVKQLLMSRRGYLS